MKATIILGGQGGDIYYELGLVQGLLNNGLSVEVIGNNAMQQSEVMDHPRVSFHNLRQDQNPQAPLFEKFTRIMKFYWRLIRYALSTESRIFHIQWLNKFLFFDRIVLNLYYKMLGKKLVFTAHNVDPKERDGNNSTYNRITLKGMYRICDHIIVHTPKMKEQLMDWFDVRSEKVSVVPYGINDMVPKSDMSPEDARHVLKIHPETKTLLFFGFIAPYKGLDILISALPRIKEELGDIRLIIAGNIKNPKANPYWIKIDGMIEENGLGSTLTKDIRFIEDDDIETYFKAADVLILPYRYIFQSGILFLSLNFGLPVIATRVGSLEDFVDEGRTGFMCEPEDPILLSDCIIKYFESDLYRDLAQNRVRIFDYASDRYSWDRIGGITASIYRNA
ncbi:MAG: glycosyltransferase family 4 protein [bacterium]|nr:MAG: glycosyltransferase family 4 protein [bacterium]